MTGEVRIKKGSVIIGLNVKPKWIYSRANTTFSFFTPDS